MVSMLNLLISSLDLSWYSISNNNIINLQVYQHFLFTDYWTYNLLQNWSSLSLLNSIALVSIFIWCSYCSIFIVKGVWLFACVLTRPFMVSIFLFCELIQGCIWLNDRLCIIQSSWIEFEILHLFFYFFLLHGKPLF